MSRRRFFVSGIHHANELVPIDAADAHHAAHVLRLRAGDTVEVIDSGAHRFVAELRGEGSALSARLVAAVERSTASTLRVDLAQALPKRTKMDTIVEKVTELGANAVLPFHSARTIPAAPSDARVERWRRIARSAAEQCGRADVPNVAALGSFHDVVQRFSGYDTVVFAWENADREPLRVRLPTLLEGAQRVLLVVGPEGGFSHEEADAARKRGAHVVSLGERILRTETAAPALLSIVNYLTEPDRSAS